MKLKGIALLIGLFISYGVAGTIESIDHLTGTVLYTEHDEVHVEVGNNEYVFLSPDDYRAGDEIKITMFNNGTIDPKDDIIVDAE